jgi:hypothetical protein
VATASADTASLVPVHLSRLCPRSPFQSFYAAGLRLRETASLDKFTVFKSKRLTLTASSKISKLFPHVSNIPSGASSTILEHDLDIASRLSSKLLQHVIKVATSARCFYSLALEHAKLVERCCFPQPCCVK